MSTFTVPDKAITKTEWNSDKSVYYLQQNSFGDYWIVRAGCNSLGVWCSTVIGEKPFKTIRGASNYINKYRTKWGA
jgi:hypothetical protein